MQTGYSLRWPDKVHVLRGGGILHKTVVSEVIQKFILEQAEMHTFTLFSFNRSFAIANENGCARNVYLMNSFVFILFSGVARKKATREKSPNYF